LFPKKIQVGFIYTMGADENRMKVMGIDQHIHLNDMILGRIFGESESIVVTDTSSSRTTQNTSRHLTSKKNQEDIGKCSPSTARSHMKWA
jgi:hypothetical protein